MRFERTVNLLISIIILVMLIQTVMLVAMLIKEGVV